MDQQVKDPVLSLVAWVTAVAQVWFLAWELPHAMHVAKKRGGGEVDKCIDPWDDDQSVVDSVVRLKAKDINDHVT